MIRHQQLYILLIKICICVFIITITDKKIYQIISSGTSSYPTTLSMVLRSPATLLRFTVMMERWGMGTDGLNFSTSCYREIASPFVPRALLHR